MIEVSDGFDWPGATADPTTPLAFVRLTWQTERDPCWPWTIPYPGWEAFRLAWQAS